MNSLIKVCGLTEPEHVRATVEAGASHLGFVFFPKSPRNIELDDAAALATFIDNKIKKVALVVDPTEGFLDDLVEVFAPDAIQFHGSEAPEFLAHVKHKTNSKIEIWKALGMADASDLGAADAFQDVADKLLFDARPPKGADRPGGHGGAFDWSILEAYDEPTPWLLAGGLTPDNVAEAVAAVVAMPGFAGVDVSSGVERTPGQKDPDMIARFIAAAQDAFQGDAQL